VGDDDARGLDEAMNRAMLVAPDAVEDTRLAPGLF
jgi:hypothetical protein